MFFALLDESHDIFHSIFSGMYVGPIISDSELWRGNSQTFFQIFYFTDMYRNIFLLLLETIIEIEIK